jgi:hypothetical protein
MEAAQHSADSSNPNNRFPNATRQKSEKEKAAEPYLTHCTAPLRSAALHHHLARRR